jgi:hypothetical protein
MVDPLVTHPRVARAGGPHHPTVATDRCGQR